jgi:FkbM family methyltransferase
MDGLDSKGKNRDNGTARLPVRPARKKINFLRLDYTRWSLVFSLICLALSCRDFDHDKLVEKRLSEYLNSDSAKTLLLHDHREFLAYLKEFPRDQYNLCPTKNGFSFFVEKTGHLDGIKQIVSKGQVWEEAFIELMAKYIRPGSAVIDAGAYIGTHSLAMAKLTGPRGRVYAFEPQKKVFRELVFNLIENHAQNVTPLRFALGENNRIVEMEKPKNGLEAIVRVGQGGDQAELRTLDSFKLRNISFIKIDVEGYEDHVLEGARQTLADNLNPPILIENVGTAHRLEGYGYTVRPLEYRDYLALPAPDYRLGSIISFIHSGNADQFKSGFWSEAESWGSWIKGNTADVVLPLSQVPQRDLMLIGKVKAYVNEKIPRQEVKVLINSRWIGRWVFRQGELEVKKAVIPISLLRESMARPIIRITFQIKNPISPAELKLSADKRLLGLGVNELIIREF